MENLKAAHQPPPPESLLRAIVSKPLKYLFYGLQWTIMLAIIWSLSFILYPIQLAFGLRAYRNPRYDLKRWPKYLLITMLTLSTMEMVLLGTQIWWAYHAGSVKDLHLNVLKWWQYSKSLLVLCIFVGESLSFKLYTTYLDSWIEKANFTSPEDKAEKGLLESGISNEKRPDDVKAMDIISENSNSSLMTEEELEKSLPSFADDLVTIVADEKVS